MSHAALSLALSFGHLGQLDSAYYYLDIAENIRKNDPDKSKLAQVYSYKAMITFRHGNDYKSAKEIFQKAIETVKLAGDDYSWNEGLGYVYNFLGMIDASVGNLEDAKKSNAEAKKRFQEKLKYRIPYVDAQRAQIVSMEGYQDSAIVIALEALKQAEQYGIDESIIQIHEIIVSIYERNKSYERANYHIRRLNEMRDSIGSSDHISALNSVETTLKLQEKEKEKEFLKSITLILVIGIVLVLILAIYIIILIRARAKIQQNSLLKIEEKNKELEEANFTKDKFFAIIAHDLKNPFSGFKASLELLIKEYDHLDEEDRKDILGELFEMSENVNNLLINLLTWSRSQRGGIQLNLEESNLCLLLESVKNIVNQTAKDKKIKIEVDCEVDKILIDPALMNIVLLNLTTNAVKFTPEGGEVRLIGKENENELKIIVQDNGLGISKENLDKLFNLETSFTTRGTKNEAGTGLGLIICYDFVQLHGGEISVESELNIGTKFTITLQK
jgi:signal transduction histidine kinase